MADAGRGAPGGAPTSDDRAAASASADDAADVDLAMRDSAADECADKEADDAPCCEICLDDGTAAVTPFAFASSVMPSSACGHAFCAACLQRFVAVEFLGKGRSHVDLKCPVPGCEARLPVAAVVALGGAEAADEIDAVQATIPVAVRMRAAAVLSLPNDFSYDYNAEGQLRHVRTGRKFHWINQAHYDLLGDAIVPHIQTELMVKARGLQEFQLPTAEWLADAAHGVRADFPAHVRSNIFMTPDAMTNPDKLMLLIQGSGAVRPGQWARALCINDSLEVGSILGYLDKATAAGYGVIVFNPNQNSVPAEPLAGRPSPEALRSHEKHKPASLDMVKIPGNIDPVQHTIHVWDQFAKRAAAKDVVIVAHSAGGWCTLGLLRERGDEILPKLRAIAFTDSVHSVLSWDPPHVRDAIIKLAQNWIQSDEPLDTPSRLLGSDSGCPCVSAGHPKHEYTSASAIESVFRFLHDRVEGVANTGAAAAGDEDDSSVTATAAGGGDTLP